MCGPYRWTSRPASSGNRYALPPICGPPVDNQHTAARTRPAARPSPRPQIPRRPRVRQSGALRRAAAGRRDGVPRASSSARRSINRTSAARSGPTTCRPAACPSPAATPGFVAPAARHSRSRDEAPRRQPISTRLSRCRSCRTTSAIGVETTGRPAARYSGVFVGLMNRVALFQANGIIARPSPTVRRGAASYGLPPR